MEIEIGFGDAGVMYVMFWCLLDICCRNTPRHIPSDMLTLPWILDMQGGREMDVWKLGFISGMFKIT